MMVRKSIKAEFADYVLRRMTVFDSLGKSVALELIKAMKESSDSLSEKLEKIGRGTFRRSHYRRMKTEIDTALKQLGNKYIDLLEKPMVAAIKAEYDASVRYLYGEMGKKVKEATYAIPAEVVKKILTNPIGGSFLDDWIEDHMSSIKGKLRRELTQSVLQAETIPEAVSRLRETFNLSRRGSEMIARTSILSASNQARDEFYQENEDVIVAYKVVGTLDSSICLVCAKLDGTISEKREDLPIFPIHMNCRCTVIGLTEYDLEEPGKRPAVFEEEKKTVHHRDGTTSTKKKILKTKEVSAETTFKEFFERQPEKWKREYLGKTRYDLYKKDKLSISDMVENNQIISVDELEEKVEESQ